MRLVSWFGGLLVVVVLGAGVVAVSLDHVQTPPPALTASHLKAGDAALNTQDPHRLVPRDLRPSPSPSPVPPPAVVPPASRPAPPAVVVGSTQQALINADRARNGLGPLTWNSCLYRVAVANANRIAAQGYLSHTNGPNVDLTCALGRQAGENIGWFSGGINDSWMNSKFMASPDHYANIMGPYHYVATAWVVSSDGRGWIAVEFG
jgi:uncharacterized protein YkwD